MNNFVQFDADLIRRYDKVGPRYTSYPTAVEFHTGFNQTHYQEQAALSNQRGGPLSLYFHIPFCDTICFYCACSKIVTKNRAHAEPYLQSLYREIALQSTLFDSDRIVEQLHWGGGTPTFISHQQMRDLMAKIRQNFNLVDNDHGDFSIEIDPREASTDTIKLLREIGFNRISLGLQDFNPTVQKAVNRIQTEQQTFAILEQARAEGFRSISLDLIYGLPHQTVTSFHDTLEKVIVASPDRLSIFNYAHMPDLFKTQRQIKSEYLPSAAEKLEILHQTIDILTAAGYVYIGMDHFAKPGDELALAQQNGELYRNFQGYSTRAECDLIGFGVTSIGKIGDAYTQNVKTLDEYTQRIQSEQIPIHRGIELDADDKLRRDIITYLICHFDLDIRLIEALYGIKFNDYFSNSLQQLQQFAEDGLLQYNKEKITVLPAGRLLIRNICMVFDKYSQQHQQRFSKVI